MSHLGPRLARIAAGLSFLASLTVGFALADDTVTQEILPGARSAFVSDVTLADVNYSVSDQNQTGTMTLQAEDLTGTGAGWNVTILSSAFAYTAGGNAGTAIPAANFALTAADAPVRVTGQAVDATDGPKVPSTSPVGALSSARKVVQANPDFGMGSYTQDLDVNLLIPGLSKSGTYTGTLTTTISAAP